MEALLMDVNWVAVVVGAIIAFILGWLWYSPMLFGTKWASGVGINIDDKSGPPIKALVTQAFGTFLLAWVVGITETTGSIELTALIAVTMALLIKANGFFVNKSKYAITTESSFILVMVVVMILTHAVL